MIPHEKGRENSKNREGTPCYFAEFLAQLMPGRLDARTPLSTQSILMLILTFRNLR